MQSKLVGCVIEPGPDPIVMKKFPMISKQLFSQLAEVLKKRNRLI